MQQADITVVGENIIKGDRPVFITPYPGEKCWPTSMHEYFVISFISPLVNHSPLHLRETPNVLVLERVMHYLLLDISTDVEIIMRQLKLLPKRVESMLIVPTQD